MEENRPAQPRFLDLSALRPQTQEEVSSALHRLPELRLRPDRPEEEGAATGEEQPFFPDPVPSTMRGADLNLLSRVDIPWKMLTLERPDSHVEMNIFTRIVYLTKLTLRCMEEERQRREREKALALRRPRPSRGAADPSYSPLDLRPEEFSYESFSRLHGAGAGDRGAVEEAPRPPPPPPAPSPPKEEEMAEAAPAPPLEKRKGRKKKMVKKRKIVVKKKVAKSKTGSKDKTKKKTRRKRCGKKGRNPGSEKTLVQMLKSKKSSKDTTPRNEDTGATEEINPK